jgi:drug/metabolite transporter (DMT)-like permease
MKPNVITLLSGIALLIPATFGLSLSGVPTVHAPFPALVVIPSFFLGLPALFIPSVLFFAWHPALFKGNNKFPIRTYILFVALVVLTVIWFIVSWNFSIQYEGARYTYIVCAVNAVWIAALAALLWKCRRKKISFPSNLLVHWVLFAWLAWWAFPYLGELP